MKHLRIFSAILMLGLIQCQNEQSRAPQYSEQPPAPPAATAPSAETTADAEYSSNAKVLADETQAEAQGKPNVKKQAAPDAAFKTNASVGGIADTSKVFVRTAQLRFRTPEVLKATLAIEDIAARHQGFVTNNHLDQQQQHQQLTKISPDSSLETIRFVVVNHLTIRVPNALLDTTLRAIGRWADYLDYRHVDAVDVELDLMENELNRLRNQSLQQDARAIAAQNSGKPNSALNALETAAAARARADQARIDQYRLRDKIKYSTIDIDLYQRETVVQQVVANERPVAAYSQGFWANMGDSISDGWYGFLQIILVFSHLWPLWALIAGGVLLRSWLKKHRYSASVPTAEKAN